MRLSELRGRPLLINFWATWCASCLSEMPDIKALQEEYGYDTFSVLAINAGETRDEALEFIDFLDAPFIYALDPSLIASDAYGVYGLPLSVFIDSGGVIRAVYRGHANRERLGALMTAAIEARPRAISRGPAPDHDDPARARPRSRDQRARRRPAHLPQPPLRPELLRADRYRRARERHRHSVP